MKLSVIMVTLNAAKHLQRALDSLAVQTHRQLEVIVVDGGSTDDTLAMVQAPTRLSLRLLTGPDKGIFDAMNKGLAAASGQAVYFLNADDALAQPGSLAALAQSMRRSSADIVFGDVLILRPAGDQYRSHRHVTPRSLGFEALSHQAALCSRQAFDQVGFFDTRFQVCADLDWFLRCSSAGVRFEHLPRLVCHCLAGGFSERRMPLHLQELRQLQIAHRGVWARTVQRGLAGLRRRGPRW